jgi:serine protease Do
MGWGKRSLCAAMLLACGPAGAQDAPTQSSLKLTAVVSALPPGMPYLAIRLGLLCSQDNAVRNASGGREPQDLPPYTAAFKIAMEKAGYKVVADENLFDQDGAAASDYQVAAVITKQRVMACVSQGGMLSPGGMGDARGDGSMTVEWQVYSPLKKQVVARVTTNASAHLDQTVPGGMALLITGAFANNARDLAANADFRAALSGARPGTRDVLLPGKQEKVALAGSLKAGKRAIADAVGSVVTVLTGSSSGSAFLVSTDGHMLTNAHVVGDEKNVRVRWSDGTETVAEVVRVAKTRDVALIKSGSRDREPLVLKRGAVNPGQRVFAIGSPLGKEYQGSVSSGIVSATRTIEGMRYIQSDVAISHGSSGGALLDENGAVIGITVSGIDPGVASGLHFFIPIGDAMDFLNLEQQ